MLLHGVSHRYETKVQGFAIQANPGLAGFRVIETEFAMPKGCDVKCVERTVERVCGMRGLLMALKGSLSQYPGSIHWHFKKDRRKGTLELTLYPAKSRLWSKVPAGRKALWIDETLPSLKNQVEAELSNRSKTPTKTKRPL
jgi:hypothetical protein